MDRSTERARRAYFTAGVIFGCSLAYIFNDRPSVTKLSDLRLSERKVCQLTLEQRRKAFMTRIVKDFNLQPGSLDYAVLKTVCNTGIYGSNTRDFKVDLDKVKATYEGCGWTLPKPQQYQP